MSAIKNSKVKLSKEEIKNKNELSKKIISNRLEQINDFEKNIVSKIKNNIINEPETIKSVFSISDGAKLQLERGGNQFTKADLIAIIVALDAGKISLMEDLQKLRISDLNSIIRSIIYDTNRYMIATNNSFMNKHIESSSNETKEIIKKPKEKKQSKKLLEITNSIENENQLIIFNK